MKNIEILSFGEYLRHLRTINNQTLAEVSRSISIDTSLLSKFENSKRKPSISILTRLSEHFGVSLKSFREKLITDEFACTIIEEGIDNEVFKVAEKKVEYYKRNNK